ncbi:phosphate ABC transporter permease PstA [Qipengyuania sp.]|uniref:phosphate ABC transporter permease PstA n=1 Tax=Qipengyuania sp. TaxID=2004515 RepID=UPI0035C7A57F
MNEIANPALAADPETGHVSKQDDAFRRRLTRRYRAEKRFKMAGLAAVVFSLVVLAFLLGTMLINGIGGFKRVEVTVPIDLSRAALTAPPADLTRARAIQNLEYQGVREIVQSAVVGALPPAAAAQVDGDAWRTIAEEIIDDPSLIGERQDFGLPATPDLAAGYSGEGSAEMRALAAEMRANGTISKNWDLGFLTRSDATNPQQVGIWSALKGTILTIIVTLALAFPIGVLAALYLEEYAPKNRWTDIIEVSINNLAAVPSIIFGLLGLAVFLGLFPHLRSAPVIGGLTLAIMTMPVIVISGRNAIKAVPPSIRDGALAIGASPVQVVFHHVLPLALPGILTGTIIGMARAVGETAPLLMIGMRAFIAAPPQGFTSPATVLPVQIFLWSDEVDRGFIERTSAAIVVLLLFLLAMNGFAIYLRNKFEKKW